MYKKRCAVSFTETVHCKSVCAYGKLLINRWLIKSLGARTISSLYFSTIRDELDRQSGINPQQGLSDIPSVTLGSVIRGLQSVERS